MAAGSICGLATSGGDCPGRYFVYSELVSATCRVVSSGLCLQLRTLRTPRNCLFRQIFGDMETILNRLGAD